MPSGGTPSHEQSGEDRTYSRLLRRPSACMKRGEQVQWASVITTFAARRPPPAWRPRRTRRSTPPSLPIAPRFAHSDGVMVTLARHATGMQAWGGACPPEAARSRAAPSRAGPARSRAGPSRRRRLVEEQRGLDAARLALGAHVGPGSHARHGGVIVHQPGAQVGGPHKGAVVRAEVADQGVQAVDHAPARHAAVEVGQVDLRGV